MNHPKKLHPVAIEAAQELAPGEGGFFPPVRTGNVKACALGCVLWKEFLTEQERSNFRKGVYTRAEVLRCESQLGAPLRRTYPVLCSIITTEMVAYASRLKDFKVKNTWTVFYLVARINDSISREAALEFLQHFDI